MHACVHTNTQMFTRGTSYGFLYTVEWKIKCYLACIAIYAFTKRVHVVCVTHSNANLLVAL